MNRKSGIHYGRLPYYIIITLLSLGFLSLNYIYLDEHTSSNSENINNYNLKDEDLNKTRNAAVAGLFYPADAHQLSGLVEAYLANTDKSATHQPRIIIVPHAGYQYSAQIAASAYQKLIPFAANIKNVFLVGPSHYTAVQGAALSDADKFKTPLGTIPVNKKINNELAQTQILHYQNNAHSKEHSLEVQLPFLQKTLKDFTIIPIAYGNIMPEKLADILKPYLEHQDTLLVISADLSHYLDYDQAKATDEHTANLVKNNLPLEQHLSCGATGINTALILAKEYHYHPILLDMANSGDTGGERQSVVGYASWIFDSKNEPQKQLSLLEQEVENLNNFARHYGKNLMDIAEKSLEYSVTEHKKFIPSRNDWPDIVFNKGASFVTLKKNGKLRGCIGSLSPHRAVALDIAANAFAAALEDERFSPLTAQELPDVTISLSLLTGYEPIHYKDEQDLLNQLQAGTDGLVIRDGNRQGLFLPSVWEELPDRKDFLKNLKLKAGLSPSYWSNNIKAYRFRVVEIKKDEN